MFFRPTLHAVNGEGSLAEAIRQSNLEKTVHNLFKNSHLDIKFRGLPIAVQARRPQALKPFLLPALLPDCSRSD
jgi:hypothetical protein